MHSLAPFIRSACLLPLAFLLACGGEAASGSPDPGEAAAAAESQAPAAESRPAPGAPYASPEEAARAQQQAQQPGQQQPQQEPRDVSAMGYDEGDEEAAVVRVIEFSDFGCVYCASFHIESYPELHREFIATGDVVWKYIPIAIGGFPNGDLAAVAGECAGEQDRFAPMRDRLFEIREEWMASEDPTGLFAEHADDVGLDRTAFATCLEEGEGARRRVMEQNRLAIEAGVRATPTFVIQGHPVEGAPPLEMFQQALRELVAEARGPGR